MPELVFGEQPVGAGVGVDFGFDALVAECSPVAGELMMVISVSAVDR